MISSRFYCKMYRLSPEKFQYLTYKHVRCVGIGLCSIRIQICKQFSTHFVKISTVYILSFAWWKKFWFEWEMAADINYSLPSGRIPILEGFTVWQLFFFLLTKQFDWSTSLHAMKWLNNNRWIIHSTKMPREIAPLPLFLYLIRVKSNSS